MRFLRSPRSSGATECYLTRTVTHFVNGLLTREVVYRALATLERQRLINREPGFVSLMTREGV